MHLYGRFEHNDEALLGNLQLPIVARWPQQLVVRIPDGAWTDYFHVMRKGGPVVTSGYDHHHLRERGSVPSPAAVEQRAAPRAVRRDSHRRLRGAWYQLRSHPPGWVMLLARQSCRFRQSLPAQTFWLDHQPPLNSAGPQLWLVRAPQPELRR